MCDLYAVGRAEATNENGTTAKPFVHEVQLLGQNGEVVRVRAVFDDGAMIGAMCTTIFEKVKHRLHGWHPSQRVLRMANGMLVKSQATWTGTMELSGIKAQGTLEVFDSGGGWSFLLGKPMLRAFKASHEYENDTITVRNNHQTAVLTNQIDAPYYTRQACGGAVLAVDWKHHTRMQGCITTPEMQTSNPPVPALNIVKGILAGAQHCKHTQSR